MTARASWLPDKCVGRLSRAGAKMIADSGYSASSGVYFTTFANLWDSIGYYQQRRLIVVSPSLT
jgi:hypothetical protein